MNDAILNKYVDLINKGYCSDCNELNCICNFPQKVIAREITSLQNKYDFALEDVIKLQKENEFLRQRENKLQLIEQMFKNETVDLKKLHDLVMGVN